MWGESKKYLYRIFKSFKRNNKWKYKEDEIESRIIWWWYWYRRRINLRNFIRKFNKLIVNWLINLIKQQEDVYNMEDLICPNCKINFDLNLRLPRLFGGCGHSFCTKCI